MSGKWDEVDPRVEWAMKVMDQEGMVFESEVYSGFHFPALYLKCGTVYFLTTQA
jgi:hypothetical protein